MEKEIEYYIHPKTSIFRKLKIRLYPDEAFENSIKRGMKKSEDWMYMYSKNISTSKKKLCFLLVRLV